MSGKDGCICMYCGKIFKNAGGRRLHEYNKHENGFWREGKTKKDYPQLSNGGTKKGSIPWNKGLTKETDDRVAKIGKRYKGWILKNRKGKSDIEFYGKEKALEIAIKKSNVMTGTREGKNNPAWKDGRSEIPYPSEFNKALRIKVKQRDNFQCQECGTIENLEVHHIDNNKTNCDINNLITLCRSCHRGITNKTRRHTYEMSTL